MSLLLSRRALLAAVVLSAFGVRARAAQLQRWGGPPAAPPIDLPRVDGTPLTLAQLRGKVVLVNFWATWCEPCITEMPSLQKLRAMLGEGFEVLAVNFKEGPARIEPFVRDMNLTFPIVRDTDGSVAKAWGARIFPASYVVDRDGRVRYVLNGGADWTNAKLVSTIRALL